jgi:hypothetical protein
MAKSLLWMLTICTLATLICGADPPKTSDRDTLEQAFADRLSGSKLVGAFSMNGKDSGSNQPDKYQIVSAKKIRGNDWVITSKMKLGEKEVDIPISIKIYWADDTPVMSLTDLTIPGMGTFTARVMFYGDRYAGTWQHGEAGGHMWGIIEKPPAKE